MNIFNPTTEQNERQTTERAGTPCSHGGIHKPGECPPEKQRKESNFDLSSKQKQDTTE